jgi:hypothetical protein
VLPDGRIPDPFGEEVDLRNHPVARGCRSCRALCLDCSLMTDEYTWPCDNCVQDECDCELITPPAKKGTCEYCRRRRVPFSYIGEGSDPTQPCDTCTSFGAHRIARPAVEIIKQRICYNRDYTISTEVVGEDRRYVICTACREDRNLALCDPGQTFPRVLLGEKKVYRALSSALSQITGHSATRQRTRRAKAAGPF